MNLQQLVNLPDKTNILAEKARRKHKDYVKFLWQDTFKPFIDGLHIDKICGAIDEAIVDYKSGISTFLMIKIPFRHCKSTATSRFLPSNFIGKFPSEEVMVISYTVDLVEEFSKFSKGLMLSSKYNLVYPRIELHPDEQSLKKHGLLNYPGHIYWLGLEGTITGKGAALCIVDDPLKGRIDAESDVIREAVWSILKNNVLTRRAKTSIIIFLGTPWHIDDPFGRIKEEMSKSSDFPQFRDITFPAKSDTYVSGYLWPEYFPKEWYDTQFATLTPYESASILQCDPQIRSGNQLKTDKIKYVDECPTDIIYTRGWDLASSKKERMSSDPDYTVGIRMGIRWIPTAIPDQYIPEIYIDDVIRGRWEALQRNQIIRDTAIADGNIETGIEGFGAYKDAADELEDILSGIRKITKVQLPGDKQVKYAKLEPAFLAGNVYLKKAPWNQPFLDEVGVAPAGKHDDQPDAAVVAYSLHKPMVKRVWPSFCMGHVKELQIDWDSHGPYTTFHYAALSLQKDMRLCMVSTLWDNRIEKLYIYHEAHWEHVHSLKFIDDIEGFLKIQKYKIDKILGNELMFAENESEQTVSKMVNGVLKHRNLKQRVCIRPTIKYNYMGSIAQVEDMFYQNRIIIDKSCQNIIRQIQCWALKNDSPYDKDCGFCEALCLIISELKKKHAFDKKEKPVLDYHKRKEEL